jgi:hypothetical protein
MDEEQPTADRVAALESVITKLRADLDRVSKGSWSMEIARQSAINAALRTERDALRDDAGRIEWLEQQEWDADELWELVNNWTTQDGKRHGAGLRAAIDAARKVYERN